MTTLNHSMPLLDERQALDLVDQLTALSRDQRERLARLEALERRVRKAEREAFFAQTEAWALALASRDDEDEVEARIAQARWADLKSLLEP